MRQYQRGEETHNHHESQHQYRVETQAHQRMSNADSTREPEARREASEPKSDPSGVVSKAHNSDPNPNTQLPPTAMFLLQQLLAAIADKGKATDIETEVNKGEKGTELKADVQESSAQGEARKNVDINNPPYWYRCSSRGHPKEECVAQLLCEVCDSNTYIKAHCPVYKKVVKSFAMTCGYAVDGLGFYYIPHSATPRNKGLSKSAVIKVIDGNLSAAQVMAEMERLVPGKGKWGGGG
jgi:hypothetical protein